MKHTSFYCLFIIILAGCNSDPSNTGNEKKISSQFVFPLQEQHVHGSTLVELPNGDLLTAWFQGSGERWADDVRILGSRLTKGDTTWSPVFEMADKPGFPDINPILFLDHTERLWLMWYPVIANQWETSIPMYRISTHYSETGAPVWDWQDILLVRAGDKTERGIQPNDSFVAAVKGQLDAYEVYMKRELWPSMPDSVKKEMKYQWEVYKDKMDSLSKGRNMMRSGRVLEGREEREAQLGYPLTRRIGWQTKNKGVYLGKRLIVPLYSDGMDCSLFALSDDGGQNWMFSNPVLGGAGIQPTVAIGTDSTLVAYLRDNGPPPQRMQRTESWDRGMTWSIPTDDVLKNPGSGFDMVTLTDGSWLMVFNDSENGRHNLTVALSADNGKTWPWKKRIENDESTENAGSFHYPSVIQGKDGTIHISYSYHLSDIKPGKTIKHFSFPVSWVRE